ncbi:MAG: TusE/DsrC/DsvC family sulfur relay protein [Desulfobacterales bacterium]
MKTYTFNGKNFDTDDQNFLIDYKTWEKDFATGMAYELGMVEGLTDRHWEVIRYIQEAFEKTGHRPSLYETCRAMALNANGLRALSPPVISGGRVLSPAWDTRKPAGRMS